MECDWSKSHLSEDEQIQAFEELTRESEELRDIRIHAMNYALDVCGASYATADAYGDHFLSLRDGEWWPSHRDAFWSFVKDRPNWHASA
jgi:hypothetical protein